MLGLSAATLAGYLAAIVVLIGLTPGPDMMFVLANATRYGAHGRGGGGARGPRPGRRCTSPPWWPDSPP